MTAPVDTSSPAEVSTKRKGLVARWQSIPLYLRILLAMVLGFVVGIAFGPNVEGIDLPAHIILRLLGALAPPLISVAVLQAIMTTHIGGRLAGRLAGLLVLNTVVAIVIGLAVANIVRPGTHASLHPTTNPTTTEQTGPRNPLLLFLDSVPDSIVKPLVENNVIGVIFVAVAFGIALRGSRKKPVHNAEDAVALAFDAVIKILHWVIALVPLAVFCTVANIVGVKGFKPFLALGAFVVAVVLALLLQAGYYLTRIRFGSWVRPWRVVVGMRDALVMAFSTDSSTATMPVTYACLKNNVGIREESANLGALVGSNFNNDGTALYEAMSALFVAQLIGQHLTVAQQILVMLTAIVASVGAAG
ncbi:MAG TPA: dicarboxylate/amino acid:cation symporter, partial [Tepidisphaeraceae bacterium]|nr:dicarboxylate/amino acid:cation symporter [Tepidisphaeraceae bacterium]